MIARTVAPLLLLGFAASCVGTGSDVETAPCSFSGNCLPGFRCLENFCAPCVDDECDDLLGIGAEGAKLCGVDDVCVDVPPGAVTMPVDIRLRRASATVALPDLHQLSRVYRLSPPGTTFALPLLIEIPISSTVAPSKIGVYTAKALTGPWSRVDGASSQVSAYGDLTELSMVVAAHD